MTCPLPDLHQTFDNVVDLTLPTTGHSPEGS